jgi:hypothetical protein
MEAPDDGATWPSGLWSRTEVLAYLNERQNRLLKTTGIQLGLADLPAPAGQTQLVLPQDWIATMDAIWIGTDGRVRALERSDSFEADHSLGDWVGTPGQPLLYMDYDAPVLQIQLAPAPIVSGTVQLLYVPEGAPLTGDGEEITLPLTFQAPVLKYSTLAEMFGKDGRGKNPEKATYCQMRDALGVQIAEILLRGRV